MTVRHGFTLMEVLMAVALLTMLASAAISWAVAQRRSGAVVEERLNRLEIVLAAGRLISDDLIFASNPSTVVSPTDAGELHLLTLHHVPGEEPGQHQVIWRFSAEHSALMRISSDATEQRTRVAVPQIQQARFQSDDHDVLDLIITPFIGEPLCVPIASARP